MGGIKADRGDVAEGTDLLSLPRGAQGIAAVFYKPQVVFLAESSNRIQIEDVSQSVGDHHGLHPGRVRLFQLTYVNLIRGQRHIEKYRDQAVLDDGIDRCRKTRGNRDDFVAGFQLPITEPSANKGPRAPQDWRTSRN